MAGQSKLDKWGKKIDESEHVWIVTNFVFQNMPDAKIVRQMQDRYGFKVSIPSLMAFKRNYYPQRLASLKKETIKFKQEQSGQIQTFIDESLVQSDALKSEIQGLARQLQLVTRQLEFVRKFENLFQTAVERYVENFDPAAPQTFVDTDNPSSQAQAALCSIVAQMGPEGRNALTTYIETHNPSSLVKLATLLTSKLKDLRCSVTDIHKDIFKSYRNLSISQEMTIIFERYNGIIIEEFFPDKQAVDAPKFARVNQKIRALFDELNTRYQGVETPSDQGKNPTEAQFTNLPKDLTIPPVVDIEAPVLKVKKGRQPAKSTVIARERAAQAAQAAKSADEVELPQITEQEAQSILEDVERQQQNPTPDPFKAVVSELSELPTSLPVEGHA